MRKKDIWRTRRRGDQRWQPQENEKLKQSGCDSASGPGVCMNLADAAVENHTKAPLFVCTAVLSRAEPFNAWGTQRTPCYIPMAPVH